MYNLNIYFAIVFLLIMGSAQASTLTVCPSGCEYNNIQAAIDASSSGDTIEVHSGTYNEEIDLNKDIKLKGVDTGNGKPSIGILNLCGHPKSSVSGFVFGVFNSGCSGSNSFEGATITVGNKQVTKGSSSKTNKIAATTPSWDAKYWCDKGDSFYDQGKYDEAIHAYGEAIKINPKYTFAWNQKGVALYMQGKYDEAIDAYDEAIELDKEYATAWSNRGAAYAKLGKYQAALQHFEFAVQLNPKLSFAWFNLGSVLEKLGQTAKAQEAFDKAEDLELQG